MFSGVVHTGNAAQQPPGILDSSLSAKTGEAKETDTFIGRTPELPHSLHFKLVELPHSHDSGFDALKITRKELVEILLGKQQEYEEENKGSKFFFLDASSNALKQEYLPEIQAAIGAGFLKDAKGAELYQQYLSAKKTMAPIVKTLGQQWHYYAKDSGDLLDFLNNKLRNSRNSGTTSSPQDPWEKNPLKKPNETKDEDSEEKREHEVRQLEEAINQLQESRHAEYKRELDKHCLSLFNEYLTQLGSHLPLSIESALRYARSEQISLYIWRLDPPHQLTLINRHLNKDAAEAPIHILSTADGHFNLLINTSSEYPLQPAEEYYEESEIETARRLAGITPEGNILLNPNLVAEAPRDLRKQIAAGKIPIKAATFWEDVVGNFPLYSCYEFRQIPGAPTIELLARKLRTGGQADFLMEPWANAILFNHVREIAGAFEGEGGTGIAVSGLFQFDSFSGHNRFFALDGDGYANDDQGSSHLVLLQNVLNEHSYLLLDLLHNEDVVFIVKHFTRLQAVFLKILLTKPAPLPEKLAQLISIWLQILSPFVVLRCINETIATRDITLMQIKQIKPMQDFLAVQGLGEIEDPYLFVNTVCQQTYRFLERTMHTVSAQEQTSRVEIAKHSTHAYLTSEFTHYCLTAECSPDWYVIYQYLIAGAKVSSKVLMHFAKEGYLQALRAVLEVPDIDANRYANTETPLMGAAIRGHADIAAILLGQAETNVNRQCLSRPEYEDGSEYNALTLAVNYDQTEVVRTLLTAPAIRIDQGHSFNTYLNYEHKDGTLLSLVYQKDRQEILKLLFQSSAMGKLSDEEFLKLFPSSNLLDTAAAISHDLVRCANLVLSGTSGSIIDFLIQIPGIDINLALTSAAGDYRSVGKFNVVTRLLQFPGLQKKSVDTALLNLLRSYVPSEGPQNNEDLQILHLLLKQPGIDVNQEYEEPSSSGYFYGVMPPKKMFLLSLALRYPECAALFLQHPNLDAKIVYTLISDNVQIRATLVREAVTEKFMSSSRTSYYDYYDEVLNDPIRNEEDKEDVDAKDLATDIESLIQGIEKGLVEKGEGNICIAVPQRWSTEVISPMFWPLKDKCKPLLANISLLLKAKCLTADHLIPLLEKAAATPLVDVIDLILASPPGQALSERCLEYKAQNATTPLASLTRFFVSKLMIRPEDAVLARCLALLREHTKGQGEVAETVLSYVNGNTAEENKIVSALGALYIYNDGLWSKTSPVDVIPKAEGVEAPSASAAASP